MGKSEDPSNTSGHKLLWKLFGNNTIVYVTDSRGSTKRNKKVKKAEMKQKVCDVERKEEMISGESEQQQKKLALRPHRLLQLFKKSPKKSVTKSQKNF